MRIIEVNNQQHAKLFHDVGRIIYKNDNTWVCPIDEEIEAIFDPKKNVYFEHGDAARWLLYNDNEQLIGRVAAFIDKKMALKHEQPTGGMGFFECINDKEAAFVLFDMAHEWLKKEEWKRWMGLSILAKPISIGDFWSMALHILRTKFPIIIPTIKLYSKLMAFKPIINRKVSTSI